MGREFKSLQAYHTKMNKTDKDLIKSYQVLFDKGELATIDIERLYGIAYERGLIDGRNEIRNANDLQSKDI